MPNYKIASEHIYDQLREDLSLCRIKPGEKLHTGKLRERFGVSFSVVREALARLAAQGFAVADPQRGFTAAPISADDLRQITEARIGLEALCLHESIKNGESDWEARVMGSLHVVLSTAAEDSEQRGRISQVFRNAHDQFHDALISSCENIWLLRPRDLLISQSERYRQICIPLEPGFSNEEAEYREIAAAAVSRNADLTVALVANRFRKNTEHFVTTLRDSFADAAFWCDVSDPPSQPVAGH